MKKILAMIMVLALVFSLGMTAFATENTGSITITNATKEQTYTVYKLFDATYDAKNKSVSYSIEKDSEFYDILFDAEGNPTASNTFFVINNNTNSITKADGVNDTDLVEYVRSIVTAPGATFTKAAEETLPASATTSTITIEDLPYGYYVIISSLGAAVTINSNTPNVEVIDKNQKPGAVFNKQIKVGKTADNQDIWGEENSASIGDIVTYKITMSATNYDGIHQIKYYQIHDQKGAGIWAEFNSFKVFVNGQELTRGYYLCHGDPDVLNTDNWEFFGDWTNVEKTRNNAQWYLVHLGYDEYRVTIPWLEGHTVTDVIDPNTGKLASYSVNFPENAAAKFTSPATIEVIYDAAVEPNADIGATSNTNLFNRASGSWISTNETGTTAWDTVITSVYGMGILKDDGSSGVNLAGAQFRVFKDEACTDPVYVIPTDIKGVYIVDSLGTPGSLVSGDNKDTARELYAEYLEEYLGADYATKQDNLVVSQINGKLVVLGLKEGDYYLKEIKAPDGYNSLSLPVKVSVGTDTKGFSVFADANGNVADIQADDGVHHEKIFQVTTQVIHNSKGIELPSTGGEGTFWLITLGTLIAIGFAVFLITHKKMSVYTD